MDGHRKEKFSKKPSSIAIAWAILTYGMGKVSFNFAVFMVLTCMTYIYLKKITIHTHNFIYTQ